jgi:membrane protease subunit HflC
MTPTRISAFIVALLIVFIGFISAFTVNEGESALVLRLGQIVSDSSGSPSVYQPGLHFRIPLIDTVRIFDMRLQELASSTSQPLTAVTKEQTNLIVEYFARWRISDLQKFYTSTGDNASWAATLLEQRLNDVIRSEYGKYTSAQAISSERSTMMASIRQQADTIGKDQGITVTDVRIQQITLPKELMSSVFKRMATERKQFAEAKRAEGVEKSIEIKALADQKVTVIKAQARMQAAEIRAKGDLLAAQVYTQAYSSNPQFYAFYRSLEAYENSFSHKTDVLVLKPEGQFFNYFHGSQTATTIQKK